MKAQSIRRVLWLVNLVLVFGIVAAAAFYFVKVKPAAAADAERGKWVKDADSAYRLDAASAKPSTTWKVQQDDFDHIIRPDLMDRKRGPGVWPFIGPVPPKFEPLKETPTTVVEAPKGLAALGKLVGAIFGKTPTDPIGTIVFMFNEGKKNKREFAVGSDDPIEDKELKSDVKVFEKKPRVPGKYLVALEQAGEKDGDLVVKVTYDELSADNKVERKEETLTLDLNMEPGKQVIATLPSGKPGAATPVAPGGRTGPDPAWGKPDIAKVVMDTRDTAPNQHEVFFRDDASYYHWGAASADDLIRDVPSEDVKDDRGGVKATGVKPGSVASQFGVQPGDILRSINGIPVHNRDEAINVVKGLPKETQQVTVVLSRKGEDHTYVVDPRDPKVRSAAGRVRYGGK